MKHTGADVAQFELTWVEVSYDADGTEVLERKAQSDNHQEWTESFHTTIYLTINAKNIQIIGKECTGLAWKWGRTVLDERNVPLTKRSISALGARRFIQEEILN